MLNRNTTLSFFIFVALMIFIISKIFLSDSHDSASFTPLFTETEIQMLNDYESSLYQPLGSTKISGEAFRFFNYFEIPESVKNDYEFTFYLLEFNDIREIHAFGFNPSTNASFIKSKALQPGYAI
ncbi:hypothetical protein CYPRO_2740 [Cyclonatronum proteinivorum]|uniref:Uncharacterized protein n=1 Tax=Cyclonatronum proteinivorum TaxID=1457365 RepID=A0A345UNC7_9BACT|nr:hypothetical protein [Cyclonatronum proteinivorum]AXJ01979.1 hypothetical protein CYPRO_2740 [Cyclonatronum proteinivorum]